MFRQAENSGFACPAGGMGAELRFINWGGSCRALHCQRAPALSVGHVGLRRSRRPGLWSAVQAAPAHGHQRGPTAPLAWPPPPLQSSLSLPLTRRSPGSPGEGQEHTWGRGCAWSQGPSPPLRQPSRGVTEPPDLPLRPQPPRASRHASLLPLHAYTLPPASRRTQEGTQEVSARGVEQGPGRSPGAGSPSTCAAGPWRPRLSSALSRWRGAGRSPPGSCPVQRPAGRGWQWGWEAGVLPGSAGNSRCGG